MDLYGLGRVDMDGGHKPSRNITSDRDERKIHVRPPFPNVFEIERIVPGISGEIESFHAG